MHTCEIIRKFASNFQITSMKNLYTYISTRILRISLSLGLLCISSSGFAQTYANLPYYTGFETGALDASWTAVSTQAGVNIEVIQTGVLTWSGQTAYSYSGNYFLGMDYGTGAAYNLNQADLHLNLAGESSVRLEFWWAEWNDETEVQDGIFVSDNGGLTFTKILDLNGASYTDLTWTHFNMSIDSVNTLYGLSATSNYIVRFQQYDNYYFAGGNDGFLFDEIEVYGICTPAAATISASACDSYTVPSGDETYYVSGMYMDTIPSVSGCDSVMTIDVTINPSSLITITETACDSYLSPAGMTYTSTGLYTDFLTSAAGCDSIVMINLTVNYSTSSTINESGLNTYTAPSGAVYTSSGTYTDVIPNAAGCDSVITINLSLNYTGLKEALGHSIEVFPNPTNSVLHIQGLSETQAISRLEIVDMRGRIAMLQEKGFETVNVQELENGMYYLLVHHAQGVARIPFTKE